MVPEEQIQKEGKNEEWAAAPDKFLQPLKSTADGPEEARGRGCNPSVSLGA